MNAIAWTFSGITLGLVAAYIVGLIQNIEKLQNFTAYFIAPAASAVFIGLTAGYLPDTSHSLNLMIIGTSIFLAGNIFYSFSKYRPVLILPAKFLYFANLCFSVEIFRSILSIARMNVTFYIIISIIFVCGYIVLFILSTNKNTGIFFKRLPIYAVTCALTLLALISIVKDFKLYSIFLFCGSILLLGIYVFSTLNEDKNFVSKRIFSILETAINSVGQIFIAASVFSMVLPF